MTKSATIDMTSEFASLVPADLSRLIVAERLCDAACPWWTPLNANDGLHPALSDLRPDGIASPVSSVYLAAEAVADMLAIRNWRSEHSVMRGHARVNRSNGR
jgi:hypothetical protein